MRQRGAYTFKILSPTLTHGAQYDPFDLKIWSTETPRLPSKGYKQDQGPFQSCMVYTGLSWS